MTVAPDRSEEKKTAARHPLAPLTVTEAGTAARAALARRGITDLSAVQVDAWPASNFGLEADNTGRRLARCVACLLDGPRLRRRCT